MTTETDKTIQWEDPPGDLRSWKKTHWDDLLDAVRERPGEWARIYEGAAPHQRAAWLRRKVMQLGEKGQWEIQARGSLEGTVHVRFNG